MADAAPNPNSAPNPASTPEPGAAPAAPPTPAPITITLEGDKAKPFESFLKDNALDTEALTAALTEGQTLKAAVEERAKAIPAEGKYDFGLPKDWKAPEGLDAKGMEWAIPESRQAVMAELGKEYKLSQSEMSGIVSKLAAAELVDKVAASKAASDAHAAEMSKLGTDAAGRLKNVMNYLAANLDGRTDPNIAISATTAPKTLALVSELTTAAAVEAVEALINAASARLATPKSGTGSDAPKTEFVPGSGSKLLREYHSNPNKN